MLYTFLESDLAIKVLHHELNCVFPVSSNGHISLAQAAISFLTSLDDGVMMYS